jgi:hypothetical protein
MPQKVLPLLGDKAARVGFIQFFHGPMDVLAVADNGQGGRHAHHAVRS